MKGRRNSSGSVSPEAASVATVLALAALIAACTRSPPPPGAAAADPAFEGGGRVYPVHVRDDRGAVVTVRAEPQRIVALLPSHTETLFALGLGTRVVGVDDWAGSARTFDDIFRVIDMIGQLCGRGAEATRLSQHVGDEIAAVENRLRGQARVRVYYELDATPYTVGPGSFIGVMLAKAGGENIVPADLGDFPKISPEAVIAGNPSIMLGASLEEIRARPGWDKIAAVREARVFKLPKAEAQLVARPGPRIADGLRALARRLHPEVAL